MDSYIVRIYRRDCEAPEMIAGTIELIDNRKIMPFRTMGELAKILLLARGNAKEDQQAEG